MPSIRTLPAGDTGRQGRVPPKPREPPGFESASDEASESLFRIVRGGSVPALGKKIPVSAVGGIQDSGVLVRDSMQQQVPDTAVFDKRFATRAQAERYRDRYKTGRRARMDRLEHTALRALLDGIGRLSVALDLPSGVGRFSPVLAEVADRVILADSSAAMLEVAREDALHPNLEYLQTDALDVRLPDRSVDLVFCHRLLNHIPSAPARARVLREVARVTRRYVVLSYYAPSFRGRLRMAIRRVLGTAQPHERPTTMREFVDAMSAAKLRLWRREILRRFPLAAMFLLFERV